MSRVGFWGMGGIGKTLTGAAIVRDDAVRDHFDAIVWLPLGQTPVMPKRHPPFGGPDLVAIVVGTGDAVVVADLSNLFAFPTEPVDQFTGYDPVTNLVLIAGQHWDDSADGLQSPSTLVAALWSSETGIVRTLNITRLDPHCTDGVVELVNMGSLDTKSGIMWFTVNARVPGTAYLQQRLYGYDIRNGTLAFDSPTPLNTYALAYDAAVDTLFAITTCCPPNRPCAEPFKSACRGTLNISVDTTACKRLFSPGCVAHTDGAVFQIGEYEVGSSLAPKLHLTGKPNAQFRPRKVVWKRLRAKRWTTGVVKNSDPPVSGAIYMPTGVLATNGIIHMQALLMFAESNAAQRATSLTSGRTREPGLIPNPFPSKLVSYSTTTGQQLASVGSGNQDRADTPCAVDE